jgi:hypothetical protein
MGLAWTSHGGSTLYIETLKQQRKKKKSDDESASGTIEFTGSKPVRCDPATTPRLGPILRYEVTSPQQCEHASY